MIKNVTQLVPGDVVSFYDAHFRIIDTFESRGHIDGHEAYGKFRDFIGPSPVAVAVGECIKDEGFPKYYMTENKFKFQGNSRNSFNMVTV